MLLKGKENIFFKYKVKKDLTWNTIGNHLMVWDKICLKPSFTFRVERMELNVALCIKNSYLFFIGLFLPDKNILNSIKSWAIHKFLSQEWSNTLKMPGYKLYQKIANIWFCRAKMTNAAKVNISVSSINSRIVVQSRTSQLGIGSLVLTAVAICL